jgi:hypothetical protein
VTDLAFVDVEPVLAKIADLDRELVLVGGQAVNFWASRYAARVETVASEAPFTSKDIDFCGDQRAVRRCAERLGGRARLATFDDATPNSGTVVFVDGAGTTRTLDVVSAPFGLDAEEVHATAVPAEIAVGLRFYVMHPVLCMESRVHNVAGLAGAYDTDHGRKQLRLSILCAREFVLDVINGRVDDATPIDTTLKLNERLFRFCTRDRDAKQVYRTKGVDPSSAIVVDARLPEPFRVRRYPQMLEMLAARARGAE